VLGRRPARAERLARRVEALLEQAAANEKQAAAEQAELLARVDADATSLQCAGE